ncbi:coiled-coil domain-containing protein 14 isoform X1 [Osmerus mordax]|uniref:coiled-coil domain-containing protein 14 isoform X1 n=1 Tax=Osmerus mordax TaxID=8014 RepID=UPI00350FED6A
MTRQGSTKYKVVSSGRLTGLGRGQAARKRVIGRTLRSAEPAYSLYSTDSEEPVATIHKGLDRCAALLDGILQAETTEANTSSACVRKAGVGPVSRPLSTLGKQRGDTERRKLTKKVKKPVPAPVQKTILSSQVNPGEKNNDPIRSWRPGTRFNRRLTTSTPTFSPERVPSDGTGTRVNRPPSAPPGQHRDPIHKGTPVLNAVLSACRDVPAMCLTSASSTAPSLCWAQPCCVSEVGPPAAPGGVRLGGGPCLGAPCLGRPTQSPPTSSCGSEVGKSCYLESVSCPHSQSKPHVQPVPSSGDLAPLAALSQSQHPPHPGSRWAHREGAAGAPPGRTEEEEGEDIVPTRDTSAQTSLENPTPAAYTIANLCVTCTKPHSRLGSGPAQSAETPPGPPHPPHPLLSSEACSPEKAARKVMTVQYLLGELKALLAGQDGVAERLLSDLEETVSLLPVMVGSSNVQAEIAMVLQPLRNENAQLRRRLRILNHQLQERERAEREARSLLCDSEMMTLQGELSDAQARIQELHGDNAQLRQALQDTQSQLQKSKSKNDCISKEEHARGLGECRRENAALGLVAQQKQAEVERLQQLLRDAQGPVLEPPAMNTTPPSQPGLTRRALDQHQDQQVSAGHGSDAVSIYLKSLGQKGPGSPPCKGPRQSADQDLSMCVSVDQSSRREGEDGKTKLAQTEDVRSAFPVAMSQKGGGAPAEAFTTGHRSLDGLLKAFNQSKELPSRLNQSNVLFPGGLVLFPVFQQGLGTGAASELESSLLSSDVRSDSSALSSSTFDTRDEQEFRDGLAALDASIASLQKTIQLDLKK